jgi:hypothetical protein
MTRVGFRESGRLVSFALADYPLSGWFDQRSRIFMTKQSGPTFTAKEWVNSTVQQPQARASIWLNQVALREAPD